MFQPFGSMGPPYDQNQNEPGRPPSRLEVQQQYLDHKRNQYRDMQRGVQQPSLTPFGGLFVNIRHSFGYMLINLGQWMARETARTASGPDLVARR